MSSYHLSVGTMSKAAIWNKMLKIDCALAGKFAAKRGIRMIICWELTLDHTIYRLPAMAAFKTTSLEKLPVS